MNDWLQSPLFPYAFGLGCALVAFALGWIVGHLIGAHREKARAATALAQAGAKAREDLANVTGRLQMLQEQRQTLLDEFKSLSIATLDDQSERAERAQRASLLTLLQPLQGDLRNFRDQLTHDHDANTRQASTLARQLTELSKLTHDASTSASTLASALRGSTNIRGRWGETTLQNLLELAGLPDGIAFRSQPTLSTPEKRQRPDVIVNLPGDRFVVIDAKAVLTHYLAYIHAPDAAARATAAKAHAAALRTQIAGLASRAYETLPGLEGRQPDFVLLFVPSEPAYALALDTDPSLLDDAARTRVLPVSPVTLLAALRIIELLWRAEKQLAAVSSVYSRLNQVYAKYSSFASEMNAISEALDKARSAYDRAFALLSTGKGNLVRQMELFRAQLPPQKIPLPQPFADAASIPQETDHDT